jgi:hypothetical protein
VDGAAGPHCRLEVCELADSDYERELEKGNWIW